jgi:hypothetical protein
MNQFSCELDYPEQIEEKLFPYYLQLYDAVTLFLSDPCQCKSIYINQIRQAMFELNNVKSELESEGEKG